MRQWPNASEHEMMPNWTDKRKDFLAAQIWRIYRTYLHIFLYHQFPFCCCRRDQINMVWPHNAPSALWTLIYSCTHRTQYEIYVVSTKWPRRNSLIWWIYCFDTIHIWFVRWLSLHNIFARHAGNRIVLFLLAVRHQIEWSLIHYSAKNTLRYIFYN